MRHPPPNPKAEQARAEIVAYNAPLVQNQPHYEYRLTWPATLPAVCTIGGQWQRNDAGEIEAWYTSEQLRLCLVATETAREKNREVKAWQ